MSIFESGIIEKNVSKDRAKNGTLARTCVSGAKGATINNLTGGVGQKCGGVTQLFLLLMGGSLNFLNH